MDQETHILIFFTLLFSFVLWLIISTQRGILEMRRQEKHDH